MVLEIADSIDSTEYIRKDISAKIKLSQLREK